MFFIMFLIIFFVFFSIINYFFESKGKPLPKWLIGIYMAAFVGVNLVVGMSGGFNPLCVFQKVRFSLCIFAYFIILALL